MPNFWALKISRKENKFVWTLISELCGRDTLELPQIFRLFWIAKKSLKSSHPNKYLPNFLTPKNLAREQAIPWLPVNWQEKEGELATVSLEFEFHLHSPVAPRWLSCQISANQCKAETSLKVKKHWKTSVKGNDIITNVSSANQHLASTFSMQRFKFYRLSCKLSFPFLPCCQSALQSLLIG